MKNIAIILLAGSSTRFKCATAKQFYEIEGKPLSYYSIKPFLDSKYIDEIVIVSKPEHFDVFKDLVKDSKKTIHYVIGGETRFKSVDNALRFLKERCKANDNILIHDGARLFLKDEQIKDLIDALKDNKAATLAIPLEDTIALIKDGHIKAVPDRKDYMRIQTPQAFKFATILKAHEQDNLDASDDTQLILNLNEKVMIIKGNKKLNKVTTIDDIVIVKEIIKGNGRI